MGNFPTLPHAFAAPSLFFPVPPVFAATLQLILGAELLVQVAEVSQILGCNPVQET